IEVPPTGEKQPWAYDPTSARLARLGSAAAPSALPSAVAIAPDGVHTAAILHLDGLDGAAADQLTLDGPDGPRQPDRGKTRQVWSEAVRIGSPSDHTSNCKIPL